MTRRRTEAEKEVTKRDRTHNARQDVGCIMVWQGTVIRIAHSCFDCPLAECKYDNEQAAHEYLWTLLDEPTDRQIRKAA